MVWYHDGTMADPVERILLGFTANLDYSRVLSGIQYLRDQGNSIRSIARTLGIAEGTLRRTWINQERAPSAQSVDRLIRAIGEKGIILQNDSKTTIRQTMVVPSEQSVRNVLPPSATRTFSVILEYKSDTNPKRPTAYRTIGPFTLGPEESLAEVLERSGIELSEVESVIWQKE